MVNKCKEMEQEYTGNNITRHLNPPYLLSNLDELNILVDSMEKILGLRYTTLLISCYRHQNSVDAVDLHTASKPFWWRRKLIRRVV